MFKEFKEFAMKGNVIDLAVGVVIGGAFGKIVSSFVSDILMPPIGLLLGKVDFSELYVNLSGHSFASLSEAKKAGAATLNYGAFINQIIDFSIIAFSVFLVVEALNGLQKKSKSAEAPTTKDCPFCISAVPIAAIKCSHCTSDLR